LALQNSGYDVHLHGRTEKRLVAGLRATFGAGVPPWTASVDVIILAVPDDQIGAVAGALADSGQVAGNQTVLHLSGILGLAALAPLRARGCALGSLHPLQSLSDPTTAPERLHGAAAAVDGDAHAVAVAEELANAMGLKCIHVPEQARALYHAAAVFASNYIVVLAGVAQRLMEAAGTPSDVACDGLRHLMSGTVRNLEAGDAVSALTGPVTRGDAETMRRHLTALSPEDADLYRALAHAAMSLVRLSPIEMRAVQEVLEQ